jgi:hypothetical protein
LLRPAEIYKKEITVYIEISIAKIEDIFGCSSPQGNGYILRSICTKGRASEVKTIALNKRSFAKQLPNKSLAQLVRNHSTSSSQGY